MRRWCCCTGKEMIVWGGEGKSSLHNTGGRYNPVTDTWTPVDANGAPSARNAARAVWTGTEAVVWGGRTGNLLQRRRPVRTIAVPHSGLRIPCSKFLLHSLFSVLCSLFFIPSFSPKEYPLPHPG